MFDSDDFIKLIETEKDIYNYFGNLWGGLDRDSSKDTLISSIYGGSPELIAKICKIDINVAIMIQSILFHRFPNIRDWIGYVRFEASKKSYIENPFGRRRSTKDLKTQALMNYPAQSSLADIKMVVIRDLHDKGLSKYLRLDFHDALVFEIPDSELNDIASKIYKTMVKPNIGLYFDNVLKKLNRLNVKMKISNNLWFK